LTYHYNHVQSSYPAIELVINSVRKFGKQIQRQQLDLPEYAASFLNYKSLKKVWDALSFRPKILAYDYCQLIKKLSATPTISPQGGSATSDVQAALRANKEVFFFRLVSSITSSYVNMLMVMAGTRD
jgi:hypothetical protein